LLTHIIREEPGLSIKSGELYTILAELYNNALDHGVLGLDSRIKTSTDGFAEYYRLKEERLLSLEGAWIKITLEHSPEPGGGALSIRVVDSGKGFDYQKLELSLECNDGYSGRGVPLLRKLCRSLEFHGVGNSVAVDYEWPEKKRMTQSE
jgi:hypothetical protein